MDLASKEISAPASTVVSLKRAVGLGGLIALGVNCTVGAGILGLPGKVFAAAGWATFSLVVIASVMALLLALCLAELGSRFSETGGPYLYVDRAFGGAAGFAIAWVTWLSISLAAASLLNLFADYFGILFPLANSHLAHAATAVAIDVMITVIVLAGIGESAWVSTLLTAAKIALLCGVALVGLCIAPAVSVQHSASRSPQTGLLILLFAFFGFDRITAIAGEVVNPRRTVPIALVASVGLTTALYTLVFLACFRSVPNLGGDERPLASIMHQVWGNRVEAYVLTGSMVILLGTLASQFITTPRMLVGPAIDDKLPSLFSRISATRGTPDFAIVATAIAIAGLALTGNFVSNLSTASSSRMLVFLLCCASLVKLRYSQAPPARFMLPGGIAIAVIAGLACSAVIILNIAEWPRLAVMLAAGGLVALCNGLYRQSCKRNRKNA